MTDNEIIKAKEVIRDLHTYCFLTSATYKKMGFDFCENDFDCLNNLLDLINRQKAEIEQLRLKNRVLSQNRITMPERLEIVNNARNKAIREFAEKLKESAFDVDVSFGYGKECYDKAVAVIEIDNLVKEMVGEDNDKL